MTGKLSIVVPIKASDYEIIKVLQEHCFTITDTKLISGRNILLEIEVFSIIGNKEIENID